ncbi:adenosylmethionine decarboxylase [Tissierella simiarum]|uniref:adenosylmethionine decarboxylase n=1 Tax=Tissierella simiarum TaxID=2841534 RepID=UPI001FE76BD4|nr:adenosylmethionine decarboxylase [Tissierella simiarum]
MIKSEQLGRHILVEYYNCDNKVLNNAKLIEGYMIEAAKIAKATVVESVFHTFNPWGVSGAVIIEESHLTIHTWPEYSYAAVDLFTCGTMIDPWAAFEYLEEKLKAEKTDSTEISRGIVDRILRNNKGRLEVSKLKTYGG